MFYEFFRFEIKYRLKRPETYFFFLFLFLFSLMGVEFVFQGVDLGLIKKNSPLVIAKSMGAITGLSMVIVSMIMGVPILRDFQYDVTSILYINPISKKHYLLGRFSGSFVILLFIFSAVLWGMVAGESMPWADPGDYQSFQFINYLQPFIWVTIPILFFGSSVFFVAGALSKKMMVVYIQGLIIFVLFMISKSITNQTIQAILDPFSLATLSKVSEDWTIKARNTELIPVAGIMLLNKFFWVTIGLAFLMFGYFKFRLMVLNEKVSRKKPQQKVEKVTVSYHKSLPSVNPLFNYKAKFIQLYLNTWFHSKSILMLPSFLAILLCCFITVLVNSIHLGTYYEVDSYPTTYLIIEELQEMSVYFFMVILVVYSGEIMWKEKDANFDSIYDSAPLNNIVNVGSRFLALIIVYVLIMISLIVVGIMFQTYNGYYHFEPDVYFTGFFLELLPLLAIYTCAAFFFQAFIGNKFLGMLATITFAIINVALGTFGIDNVILKFGGHSLAKYSDMNGYGHFLAAYLWVKMYWLLFGFILLILASLLKPIGNDNSLKKRWMKAIKQMGKPVEVFSLLCFIIFIGIGSYIYYNNHIVNEYGSKREKNNFRAGYEKTLKHFEYLPQPKIVDVNLTIELYPSKRAYEATGYYLITNTSPEPIREIHVQKRIDAKVELTHVEFNRFVTTNNDYKQYHYTIYQLGQPFSTGDTIRMNFRQTLQPEGFEVDDSNTDIVYNGTFFDNGVLPGFGYQKKYELQDEDDRKYAGLVPLLNKARRDDANELGNARSGSDSEGITLEMIIGTEAPQTAMTSGDLIAKWNKNGRNYFHFKTNQRIIHFYPILSARYAIMKDTCIQFGNTGDAVVDLEIFYQKGHEYNLNRMMESMKMSLAYYSKHFSPYPYKQLRIVEFPRYQAFAQSLPGLIPFSEASGFVMDIDDINDVDMAFYITAHEVAHQWWGMQLEAANVQGHHMILETLAQYSALMVFKEKYTDEKVQQLLRLQLELYRKAALKSKKKEPPLALVENEKHIYYNKGLLNMYKLQSHIGEKKINSALQHFLNDWRSFNNLNRPDRYSTTHDLIRYFRQVTPDSLQLTITDLFEKVNSTY